VAFSHFLQEEYAILYIRTEWKEIEMKVTYRSDSRKSGHLLISFLYLGEMLRFQCTPGGNDSWRNTTDGISK
jgi:hypothetical protein